MLQLELCLFLPALSCYSAGDEVDLKKKKSFSNEEFRTEHKTVTYKKNHFQHLVCFIIHAHQWF